MPTHDHGLSGARGRALPRPTRRGGSGRVALSTVAAAGTALAVLGLSAPPTGAQTVQDLKREIDTLQKRLEQLERAPAKAPAEGIRPGPEKGSFFVPGTNTAIKLGGFVSADLQYDVSADSGSTFGAGALPLKNSTPGEPGAHNNNIRLTARNSRLNFSSLTPTDFKAPVKGFVEFDFEGTSGTETFTNSHNARLRHAYVDVPVSDDGTLTFGQTWSSMFTFGTSAPSLGFGGTSGGTFGRVPQIRYTHKVMPGLTALVSVENPELSLGNDPATPTISASEGLVAAPNDFAPDIDWRVDWSAPWGPVQVGMLNHILHIDRGGFEDTAWAYGFIGNTAVKLPFDTTFYFQSTYGEGFGALLDPGFASGYLVNPANPLTGCTGAALATCEIETSTQWALKFGVGHNITPTLQVNGSFGVEQNDVVAGFTGDPTQNHWTAETNLLWKPIPEKVPGLQVGLQYTHGQRTTARTNSEGEADRIHFQTLYNF